MFHAVPFQELSLCIIINDVIEGTVCQLKNINRPLYELEPRLVLHERDLVF